VSIGGASTAIRIGPTAPGLFRLNAARVAAALAVRVANGQSTQTPVPVFNCGSSTCRTVPIALDAQSTVHLSLYGTGIRHGGSVTSTVGGVSGRFPIPERRARIQAWTKSTSRWERRCEAWEKRMLWSLRMAKPQTRCGSRWRLERRQWAR
jgi:hypothetical protein